MDSSARNGPWPSLIIGQGPLPTVDPEDILPLDDNPELVKEDLALANTGRGRNAPPLIRQPDGRLAAGNLPTTHRATPPPGPPPAWVTNTCPTTIGTRFPIIGNTRGAIRSVTRSFRRWPGRASQTTSIPWPPNPAGLVNNPGRGIAGEDGVYTFTTLAELLQHSKHSWKYYDEKKNPKAHSLWNPMPGFKAIANSPEMMSHLVSLNEFYADAKADRLPEVCWIVPTAADSEHPPADSARGMWHVTGLVNAVMQSPAWKETASSS